MVADALAPPIARSSVAMLLLWACLRNYEVSQEKIAAYYQNTVKIKIQFREENTMLLQRCYLCNITVASMASSSAPESFFTWWH